MANKTGARPQDRRGYVIAGDVIKLGPINHNEHVVRREALEYYHMMGGLYYPISEEPEPEPESHPWPDGPIPLHVIRAAFRKIK